MNKGGGETRRPHHGRGMNGKIKGAQECSFDGIDFKSRMEMRTYQMLKAEGYDARYEPVKYELTPKSVPTCDAFVMSRTGLKQYRSILPMTYTPDFIFEVGGRTVIVECKGFKTEKYEVKRKIFLQKESLTGNAFFEVRTLKDVEQMIQIIKDDFKLCQTRKEKSKSTKVSRKRSKEEA